MRCNATSGASGFALAMKPTPLRQKPGKNEVHFSNRGISTFPHEPGVTSFERDGREAETSAALETAMTTPSHARSLSVDNSGPERLERLLAQNTELAVQLSRLREENAALKSARKEKAARDPERVKLKKELENRFAEIAELTRMIEDKGGPPSADIAAVQAELEKVKGDAAELEHMLVQTFGSSSWRLTAPLRGLVRMLRRQPRPAPFQTRYLSYPE
ncbi:hypothetical protein [Aestuariicoccus sp. MJ-SS9]|uniref:hypothetical protein n=1 Tax=Aestuariicoccus sp. MJ-SS9 TaxID=3079855 RepID=UPI00290C3EB8|nr:hypothetical protein [Aestuariicoccus sp. MJ-SS9]MDU8913999.1 hypothetical protein [Aestuariicoccus sp. MJ-SS9]